MSMVRAHQAAHGSTLGEAMKAMAQKHPEAYKAHEFGDQEQDREPQPQATPTAQAKTPDNSGFMELVAILRKNRGLSRAEAIKEAARRSPESHRAYVQSMNPHIDLAG